MDFKKKQQNMQAWREKTVTFKPVQESKFTSKNLDFD